MKTINNYILEKLHLDKNLSINNRHELQVGDAICIFQLEDCSTYLATSIYAITQIVDIKDNEIKTKSHISNTTYKFLKLNENDFYESINTPKHGCLFIYLNMQDSIDLLTLIYKIDRNKKSQYKLYKFFSNKDSRISELPVQFSYSDKGYHRFIQRFKNAEID